jgi:hypothetical protein
MQKGKRVLGERPQTTRQENGQTNMGRPPDPIPSFQRSVDGLLAKFLRLSKPQHPDKKRQRERQNPKSAWTKIRADLSAVSKRKTSEKKDFLLG